LRITVRILVGVILGNSLLTSRLMSLTEHPSLNIFVILVFVTRFSFAIVFLSEGLLMSCAIFRFVYLFSHLIGSSFANVPIADSQKISFFPHFLKLQFFAISTPPLTSNRFFSFASFA